MSFHLQVLEISGVHVHVCRLGREPNGSQNLGQPQSSVLIIELGNIGKVIEIRERRKA